MTKKLDEKTAPNGILVDLATRKDLRPATAEELKNSNPGGLGCAHYVIIVEGRKCFVRTASWGLATQVGLAEEPSN